jgi:hypothetical protein
MSRHLDICGNTYLMLSNINIDRIVSFAYMLSFPLSMHIHNVFHVSLLKKYGPNPNHVIDWTMIQVEHKGDFWVERVCILDQKVKFLRNRAIILVNIHWTCYEPKYATYMGALGSHARGVPTYFCNFLRKL